MTLDPDTFATITLIIAYAIGVVVGRYIVPNPRRRPVTIEAVWSFPRNPRDNEQVFNMNRQALFTYKVHLGEWLECEF